MLYLKSYNMSMKNIAQQEFRVLLHCNNPSIPEVFAYAQDEQSILIWMTYFDGETLGEAVRSGKHFSFRFIVHISLQLSEILGYLHNNPRGAVYHLDIHPDNLILSHGHLRLIDFGNAIFAEDTLKNGLRYGTPEFSAPELSEGRALDNRTDIYSLGKLILFLLANALDENKQLDCRGKKLFGLACKCIRHNPENRIQSIAQVSEILHGLIMD